MCHEAHFKIEWGNYTGDGGRSEESQKEACKNRQLLCDNLELILTNADKIINTTRFSWSKGVEGEQVPGQILEDVVGPASLAAMIESL